MNKHKIIIIVRTFISIILWIYVGLIAVSSLPPVKKGLANIAEDLISQTLKTKIEIGSISLGWLNSITIDDAYIKDQKGKEMIKISRLSTTFNIADALNGKLSIESAQIFGLKANLYKEEKNALPNYQFIINAFSNNDSTRTTPVELKIESLIIRHANVKYDIITEPYKKNIFDPNHLNINDVALTMSFAYDEKNHFEVNILRFDGKESNSGFKLDKMEATLKATEKQTILRNTKIKFGESEISIDSVISNCHVLNTNGDERTYKGVLNANKLTLKDLYWLDNKFANTKTKIHLKADFYGNRHKTIFDRLIIQSEANDLCIHSKIELLFKEKNSLSIISDVKDLNISSNAFDDIIYNIGSDTTFKTKAKRLEYLSFVGKINKVMSDIYIDGVLGSKCGELDVNISTNNNSHLQGYISTDNFNLSQLTGDKKMGMTSFKISGKDIVSNIEKGERFISGDFQCALDHLEYSNYKYRDICININANRNKYTGEVIINDPNLKAKLIAETKKASNLNNCNFNLTINKIAPYALNLTKDYKGDNFGLCATASFSGYDFSNIDGELLLDSIRLIGQEDSISPEKLSIFIDNDKKYNYKNITIAGSFINANINGKIDFTSIDRSFINQINTHLPTIIKPQKKAFNSFKFNVQLEYSRLLRHLCQIDYQFDLPIYIEGNINDAECTTKLLAKSDIFTYKGTTYENLYLGLDNKKDALDNKIQITRNEQQGKTHLVIYANAQDNFIDTRTTWKTEGKIDKKGISNNTHGKIKAQAFFTDSLGGVKTNITLAKSELAMRDTIWKIHPSSITIYNQKYILDNVGISHHNQFIVANGTLSEYAEDSLTIQINKIPVEYIQGITNFHAVQFRGDLSGDICLAKINTNKPVVNAQININKMLFKGGLMGDANLHAFWDENINGIFIKGKISDNNDIWTGVSGYISPKNKKINLELDTHNTRADFLNGFIGRIFENINGGINGKINLTGPFHDINLIGNVAANVGMTLKPTNTRYYIKGDTIKLRPYKLSFDNISIYDNDNNRGFVNGNISHKNFKNFVYDFNVKMDNLLCYDEKTFNSDKFFATLYANGDLSIKGSDGHPLWIKANISPGNNSVFAYDAATPEAISNSNFIKYKNHGYINDGKEYKQTFDEYQYEGDIYLDANLNLNKNCEIKLRMDNTDNGYMSTYGSGHIQARYHNKSPFKLNGTYYINEGKYRLYLQDIIYRDLLIQPQSQVDFVGNPFDADIHLICHHTINSVPLSDLTATTAYSSNNKAKVICLLDITGTLNQMNFKFDLDLPNVNDETRQLVKSMINSEEEMNTQIIYLLGLGRFYTNEYARMNNDSKSSQAMNSLLSSTLSGQINNMLTNVIGSDSKWNFGTGLTTGENGWDDLDVEGILSGRLLNDRLLINGNFGYRDNSITQTSNFIGDFDIRWRVSEKGNTYIKAYNQTNDRYFTKATLNTQGIGISFEKAFESWKDFFKFKKTNK